MHILGMLVIAALQAGVSDGCGAGMRVEVLPASPRQGTLFRVRVRGVIAGSELSGTATGEPLHFSPDSGATSSAFAAAPIDSTSVEVVVDCRRSAAGRTTRLTVPLSPGSYPMEHLRWPRAFRRNRIRRSRPVSGARPRAPPRCRRSLDETPRLWAQAFIAPRTSRVTSRFGSGRDFNGTVTSRHMGTDYAGAIGAPIRAVNRGIVRLVDDFYLGGKVVYVDHGAGLITAICTEQAAGGGRRHRQARYRAWFGRRHRARHRSAPAFHRSLRQCDGGSGVAAQAGPVRPFAVMDRLRRRPDDRHGNGRRPGRVE